ncbi:hypothetical protein DFH11DRAFT_1221298 [Phellopilus nigrolimitatus]|nr:hypothetical protein DFH11DRAFT_1221298 [Phellopilus nigrolimitatus]
MTVPIPRYDTLLPCAFLTAFSYNLLLTLDDEVEFVWKKKWNAGSLIYILTRYLPVFCLSYSLSRGYLFTFGAKSWLLTPFYCADVTGTTPFYHNFRPILIPAPAYYIGIIVLFSSMLLLQLRVAAIYNNRKSLVIVFYVIDTLALGFFIFLDVFLKEFTANVWVPFILLEIISFMLCSCKSWKNYRSSYKTQIKWSPILKIIVHDNLVYFALVLIGYALGIGFAVSSRVFTNQHYYWSVLNVHFLASVALSGLVAPMLYVHLKKSCLGQPERQLRSIDTPFQAQVVTRLVPNVSVDAAFSRSAQFHRCARL